MNLLIENLNIRITEEDLSCLFGDMKGFIRSLLKKDNDGFSKGMGYAQFERLSDAREAIAKYNGFKMFGNKIKLTYIEEIPHRSY